MAERTFRESAQLVILGVIIGVLPSTLLLWQQQRFARREAQLDRRILAVKEYASSNQAFFTTVSLHLEQLISDLEDLEKTDFSSRGLDDAFDAYHRHSTQAKQEEIRLEAETNSATVVVNATFGTNFELTQTRALYHPLPKLNSEVARDITRLTLELRRGLHDQKTTLHQMRSTYGKLEQVFHKQLELLTERLLKGF